MANRDTRGMGILEIAHGKLRTTCQSFDLVDGYTPKVSTTVNLETRRVGILQVGQFMTS